MSSIKETADKYREEFMRLYGGRIAQKEENKENRAAEEKTDESKPSAEPEGTGEKTETSAASSSTPEKEEPPASAPADTGSIESRYPAPVLPDFIKNPEMPAAPEAPSDSEITPEDQAWGYLLVQVRTGNGGLAVPGASVTVSKKENGKETIYRLLSTDNSGKTEVIKLPTKKVVDADSAEDYSDISTYDVTVYQKGFFREVSQNVPIFQNIKSIQTFNLTPLPYAEEDNLNNTLIYKNNEPTI